MSTSEQSASPEIEALKSETASQPEQGLLLSPLTLIADGATCSLDGTCTPS